MCQLGIRIKLTPLREAIQGLRTAAFTRSYSIPIPDAASPDLAPSAASQPSTLPLPNP